MYESGCLIIGQRSDPHVSQVLSALKNMGVETAIFDHYRQDTVLLSNGEVFSWDQDSFSINQLERLVIWPRLKPAWGDDVVHLSDPLGEAATPEALLQHRFWTEEWRPVTASIIHILQRQVSRSHAINYEGDSRRAQFKPLQLRVASELGMRIPQTTITNSATALRRGHYPTCIYKPLSSEIYPGVGTPPVSDLPVNSISAILKDRKQVGIFQERIEKLYELRVNVFGSTVRTVRIDSQAHGFTALDWRIGSGNRDIFTEIETSAELRNFVMKFLDEFDLDTGIFDFAVNKSGELVFFECNPAGQWLWLEDSGIRLVEDFALFIKDILLKL